MAFLIVRNGAGRTPVVEEVEDLDAAILRYSNDPDMLLIEGEQVEVSYESTITINGNSLEEDNDEQSSTGGPATESTEHPSAVDEEPSGEGRESSSEGAGYGSDETGA